ncbi:PHP domain-containing protein [Nigerium massiliense]|uniref:PHP domain-containing protein n=1 Tax=Nigerium massiliense TaxID=1522317 RepID=UPI0005901143|nr:PHP domain-containing protein [Nigerium massiliense]
MRIDLHTHSSVSDGTDAPAELVAKARAAGLDVVALTDHDTFDGLAEAREAAVVQGIALVEGMEFSTQRGGESVHLLGYGCAPDDPALLAELARVREGRSGRVPAMVRKLTELGMPLEVSDVLAQAGDAPSIGRPHVADALVAKGYVANRDEAFARYLDDDGPAFVGRYSPDLAAAIDLVHGAGGAAVVAHPWGRGRAHVLPLAVLESLVADHGLDGLEADHPDHDGDTRAALHRVAERLGMVATGSSDHHGAGKTHNPLGACLTEPAALDALRARISAHAGTRGSGEGLVG